MNIIAVVFYLLLNQVDGNATEIHPAKIFPKQRNVSEGSDLCLTCSLFGLKKHPGVYNVYLLKDGRGFRKSTLKQNQDDVHFTISRVNLDHSGNYSCSYSIQDYKVNEVDGEGHNVAEILVIAYFIPAALSVAGSFTVHERNRIEFKCTFSETLHTLDDCQLIYCCLKKNETFLQMQVFDVARMEASFTIEGAVSRDSGRYSCLLLPSKCFQEHWKELQGINEVFLEVQEDSIPWTALYCGFTVLILLFSLCLWQKCNKNALKVSRKPGDQLNTDVLQTDVEPRDDHFQEEDSFSMEGGEERCYSTVASPTPQMHPDGPGRRFTPATLPDPTPPIIPGWKEEDSNQEPHQQAEALMPPQGSHNHAETMCDLYDEQIYSLPDDSPTR